MLLTRAGLRHHWRHPWQSALALLGVALGVAVFVAVQLANTSAERAFTRSAEALSGAATHRIQAGSAGLDEALYAELRRAGVRPAAPVVTGFVTGPQGRPLRLLGVDPWAEAGVRDSVARAALEVDPAAWLGAGDRAVLFTEDARRLGLEAGDGLPVEIAGRREALTVAAVVTPRDPLTAAGLDDTVVVDVATAQRLLDHRGRIDRIDLVAPAGEAERRAWRARIERRLPAGAVLASARGSAAALDEMTAAFRLNLTAFSLLALLVGALLIYNAIAFSVVQRRPLLGRLRAVGVSRGRLFRGIVAEGLLLGALGTAAGIPLGYALAELLLGLVTRTITDLYFVLSVTEVALAPGALRTK
ncbi:ABC transporter permease [Halorhodospira neutriphila]|uniref:ABC transporter permease n=1 Tax=Halorhodospira neutriphila TaxID=168379 RepID=A0ABS1E524_9GAMM|nr:FtsX-like permease family protein [Halorhodospira neutriphila]MBK1726846.1 hypothetical protein [Halorhodospira neutriphila]